MPSDSKPARRIGCAALLLAFALAPTVRAQPAQMVRDIAVLPRELPPTLLAIPHRAVALDGAHYFFTSDGTHGRELWRTDGTASGTWMVKDICPGKCHSAYGHDMELHDGAIYFDADDGVHGRELWKTDGTAAGTVMVADVHPGPAHGGVEWPTSALGSLFFSARDGFHGQELWKTDGTTAGTVMVADIDPDGDSGPNAPVERGGHLLFSADDGTHGRELWRTDGESGGTEMVLDIYPGAGSGLWPDQDVYDSQRSATLGDRLLFTADDGVHGAELWITGGTAGSTEMVADILPGFSGSGPLQLTRLGGLVLFRAEGPSVGGFDTEIWASDGTEAGTRRVKDVFPGPQGSNPSALTAAGDQIFFAATSSDTIGQELWVTDGTEDGTHLVKDIRPGAEGGLQWLFLVGISAIGDRVYFGADDGSRGMEPWVSDGTEEGTVALGDLNPGALDSLPPIWLYLVATEIGSEAFFFAWDVETGWEPRLSDGTPEGTRLLRDIDDQVSSVFDNLRMPRSDLADLHGTLLFPAWEPGYGVELWRSDGTELGTERVRDIDPTVDPPAEAPFGGSSSPYDLEVVGSRVVFVAGDEEHGRELWTSDGTEIGTELVEDLAPGPDSSNPLDLVPYSGAVYFSADDGTGALARRSSGVPGDVEPLYGGPGSGFTPTAGRLFFVSAGGLHATDGTAANTTVIVPDGVGELAGAGEWLYFVRDGELWRTDGSSGGTVQVTTFAPAPGVRRAGGSLDGPPLAGVPATGSALFFADDGVHGLEPWWSDGTPEGTHMLADIRPGPESSWPRRPVTAGRQVFLWADDGTEGVEPWVSDGTEEGTRRTADLQPGAGSSFTATWESATVALFGELFFAAYRAGEGVELWRSDGTEAGTTLFQDVNPGPGSSSPDNMTLSNGRMFFTASDGVHGFELWAAPMAPPGVRLLLSASGGLFPGGTVIYTLILENTGDFALLAGPENEIELPIPPGLTVVSIAADQGTVELPTPGDRLLWDGGLPPRGVVTLEVRALVGDLPLGTEIVAHASAFFDTTGDGVAEPPVASDDPGTEQTGDATRIVLAAAPPAIPVLSLPGLLALAGLLAAAAGRLLRRRAQPAPPGSGNSPSSTSR